MDFLALFRHPEYPDDLDEDDVPLYEQIELIKALVAQEQQEQEEPYNEEHDENTELCCDGSIPSLFVIIVPHSPPKHFKCAHCGALPPLMREMSLPRLVRLPDDRDVPYPAHVPGQGDQS